MPMVLAAKGLPKPCIFGRGKWRRRWTCKGEKEHSSELEIKAPNLVKIPRSSFIDYNKEPLVTLSTALLLLLVSGKEILSL